jgi:hydroxyacylglutathione hydrolase
VAEAAESTRSLTRHARLSRAAFFATIRGVYTLHSPHSSPDRAPLRALSFTAGPLQTNTFLLRDDEAQEAVVVDPTIGSDEAFATLQKWRGEGLTVTGIWNTHGHFDHVYDNARFQAEFSVPIWGHPADAMFLDHLREQSLWFGVPAPAVAPFDHNPLAQAPTLGARRLQVLHTPGHSPGSVSFFFPDEGLCLSGDVLFAGSVGRVDLPGCSEAELKQSLQVLAALPPQTRVLCGHGPETTVAQEVATNPFLR